MRVFLSHSHKDRPFARRLYDRLLASGFDAWLDEAEMHVGDSLIDKIEHGVKDCRYLAVILSPDSSTSKWVRREVNVALTREIGGQRMLVLPLLFRDCEIPSFLEEKLYADFRGDFEAGFTELVARLRHDKESESRTNSQSLDLLQTSWQNWSAFGRDSAFVLPSKALDVVLAAPAAGALSVDLAEFLFVSIALDRNFAMRTNESIQSIVSRQPGEVMERVIERMLASTETAVRRAAIRLATMLQSTDVARSIAALLKRETVPPVRRDAVKFLSGAGRFDAAMARSLADRDNDWYVQALVARSLKQKTVLVISDHSDFAAELVSIARNAGFAITSMPYATTILETSGDIADLLPAFSFVLIVRGEEFSRIGHSDFYDTLAEYVLEGGRVFATCWVAWEARWHRSWASVLPFRNVGDTYSENLLMTYHPTADPLAAEVFHSELSFPSSFERLAPKENTRVLAEALDGTPLFGFSRVAGGWCWYLNTCQHDCGGDMRSPLTDPLLRESMERVFAWIAKEM